MKSKNIIAKREGENIDHCHKLRYELEAEEHKFEL
jgi:hypothetical protein